MRSTTILALGLAIGVALGVAAPGGAQETPPQRLDFSQDSVRERPQEPQGTTRLVRSAFVRDQTILGLTVYGPAFAAMVGDNGASAAAGYLVMAGGSFFAAAELSRRMDISEAQQLLATRMAWRGAGTMLYIATAPDGENDSNTAGAMTLLGGLGGTAAGLLVGNGLTPGEAIATAFGHDLAFVTAGTIAYAADPRVSDDEGISDQSRAIIMTGAGWLGYAAGRFYAGNAPYNVTAGDVQSLWLGTAIGATAAGAAIVEAEPNEETVAVTLLAGGLAGTFLADRFLVRRYDHTRSEGNLLALGGVAGGLMGVGVGVLVAGEAEREGAVTLGFAALGGVAGILMTERFLLPSADAGRRLLGSGRLTIDPSGVAAAAMGVRGRHALARYTF